MECPKCKSKNTDIQFTETEHSTISESDGLGGSGSISREIKTVLCKDCLNVWKQIS